MASGRVWVWLLPVWCWCLAHVYSVPIERSFEISPEENIGVDEYLSEGDIRISRRRNAVRDYYQTWINRTVPFTMEGLDDAEQEQVYSAMDDIAASSCIRFIQRTTQLDYVTIIKKDGCSSSVGRRGGEQQVILGGGCYAKGIILHELMHALGFWHEHSRPDRDSFIAIVWDNIALEHRSNFDKYDDSAINTLQTVYDYGSIMHYKNNTFAVDRTAITINATQPLPPGVQMGQRVALSDTDKVKINRLYRCNITHCPDPGVPKNGVRKGENFQVGSAVYYSCNKGYLLFGSRGRICTDVGQWTGDLPSCLPNLDPLDYCNYDDQSICGWVQDRTAQRNWTVNSRSTPSNGTGPMEDHTMATAEGWYIYLETSDPTRQGDTARLISPEFQVTSKTCMMFFYCMHGEKMGTLNVYQQALVGPGTVRSLLFTMTGDQGPDWRLGALTLLDYTSFRIVIEAVAGNSFMSDIAVDDVVIGACSSLSQLSSDSVGDTLHCSFDSGTCDWTQDYVTDVFDWTLQSGTTDTFNTGPTCDPVNCATGRYLYIEASRPRVEGDTARILTPLLHGDGWRCLLFYYSMYGQDMGSLNIRVRYLNGTEQLLWSRSGNQGDMWYLEKVDFQPPNYYKLVYEGRVGPSYRGDLAIDSVEVLLGRCSEVVRHDCTFEQDMCSWQNVQGDELDWRRQQGPTPTADTGPSSDHTGNNGYYLYVESSRTRPLYTARLMSNIMSGQFLGYCLQIWYHMYGADIGTLKVMTKDVTTGEEEVTWHISGNQLNQWHRKSLFLSSHGQDFRIIIEAVMTGAPSGLGDIALDDLSLHAGQCES